ncbi:cysteine desulfurase [Paenibacillus athensensis]|uniref:Cysteine desulfurase NifS n=1 Tax=Paenibacillus athensensis TaxID=1967502 RepID=A0A4Y8PT30_9BACL|nr:cysteine desulfurase family protein [Paenibacillus athensensis]MCD1261548.1 cysteine desulfurase [Paenibacillus athensensis]
MLYLDWAATTPPYEEVVTAVAEAMRSHYGNPSSIHGLGIEAERLLGRAKDVMAAALGVDGRELIVTSGGTESNNLAIKGAAWANQSRGRHLITTQIEHPSVLEPLRQLEESGFEVTRLPVDAQGLVSVDALAAALRPDTVLVSVMHVNNEVGSVQPLAAIGRLLADKPTVLFHVDAIQSIGKLPLGLRELGVDLCSVSAHKFRGPKGVGLLYRREGVRLVPQLAGGGQEQGVRSGTENVPLVVGMAKALRLAMQGRESRTEAAYRLRRRLAAGIAAIPGLAVSGPDQEDCHAPHIVHFTYPGMKAEVVVHALEQHGMYISTKSACASGEDQPSAVLLAMGYSGAQAASGLRVSFPAELPEAEADRFLAALAQVAEQLAPARREQHGRRRR